jgi:nicotinate phosphoribosyltransferase
MAHSYVQAHADESAAFESYLRSHAGAAMLLIDTYDTERAAHKVVKLATKLAAEGIAIRGVRIDSGDLGEHARRVRAILDAAGFDAITIFASGNLDEFRLRELVAQQAPIDGFGVGTRMNTSADAPYLDCAYKLQEYGGRPRCKRSEGKATWPGRKQVFRLTTSDGRFERDVLTLADEPLPGRTLLEPVMRAGELIAPLPELVRSREHAATELAALPPRLRSLDERALYPVDVSPALRALVADVDAHTRSAGGRSAARGAHERLRN